MISSYIIDDIIINIYYIYTYTYISIAIELYDFPRTFPMDLPMSFRPDAHGGAHAHGPLRDAQPREFQGRAGLDPKGCMNGRMEI